MFAGLVDHLWQSAWICGAITLLALMSRHEFAPLRLWLWRIAAFKFVFPFAALFAIGGRLGFAAKYPDDPAPAGMLETFRALASFASPARTQDWSGWRLLLALLVVLAITTICVRWLWRQLHVEKQLVLEERQRLERDTNDFVPRPGFLRSALLTACAMVCVAMPVLAGGLEDRQRHYELLVANSQVLRDAEVTMVPAAPGMGTRFRIDADERGVFIRNVTIQELAGIAYGVTRYYVRGDHWSAEGAQDWFIVPRYDVRVAGRILDPVGFDPLALRARITRMLAERHGLEIYVDSKCQPPCGKYNVPMPEKVF